MKDETKKLLEEVVVENLEATRTLELGTDEHSKAVKTTNEQLDKLISIQKLENEKLEIERKTAEFNAELERKKEEFEVNREIREAEFDSELERKKEEFKAEMDRKKEEFEINREDRKAENEMSTFDKIIKYSEIGLPVLMFIGNMAWDTRTTNKLLKFEETGSLVTVPSRNFFGCKLFKRKK